MNLMTVINDSMFRWYMVPIAKFRATRGLPADDIPGRESLMMGPGGWRSDSASGVSPSD